MMPAERCVRFFDAAIESESDPINLYVLRDLKCDDASRAATSAISDLAWARRTTSPYHPDFACPLETNPINAILATTSVDLVESWPVR
jgi:hypothetical protein